MLFIFEEHCTIDSGFIVLCSHITHVQLAITLMIIVGTTTSYIYTYVHTVHQWNSQETYSTIPHYVNLSTVPLLYSCE